ncbi:hypothetical protein ACX12E_16960 [Paenibacillus vandeheii]
MEYDFLPEKHWDSHDYLLYLYDVIADMIRKSDQNKLTSFKLQFDNEETAHSFENEEDMFKWMDENGFHETSVKVFQSHVFFSLLTDFCYYLYESLSCAKRGKVTVAYTLLRKPIRDNLLYLEWLLDDCEEFYSAFLYGSIEQCDVANYKIFDKTRIQKIVDSASKKTYMGEQLNNNNFLYTLRFNNKDVRGLQRIWNQSMHLITTSPNYSTNQGNLNFIFADDKIWSDYWNYYYLVMPQLITYSLEICEAIFTNISKVNEFDLSFNRSVRYAKYNKTLPSLESIAELEIYPHEILNVLKKSGGVAALTCEQCNQSIQIDDETMEKIVAGWFIKCNSCGEDHSICRYIVGIDVIAI